MVFNKYMTQLKRSLNLPLIIFYGLGTILGAGIYVLIGKVAGYAGIYTPFAFLIAAIIALFTALSYAELTSRFPLSAGEAVYVQQAFHCNLLSKLVGWGVVFTGIISTATMARGFTGYFATFITIPEWLVICLFILVLCCIASWGIVESAIIATIVTLIEILGLILVIIVGVSHSSFSLKVIPTSSLTINHWQGIFLGGFLAFYAYIGFEDMVNVAEEVKNPRKNLPLAILIVLIISTILYIAVSIVVISALPIEKLSHSTAPLALLLHEEGTVSPAIISIISLIAIFNGALIQIIMATRVLYGMAHQQHAPKIFSKTHSKTQTPILTTIIISLVTLIFSLWLPLTQLAELTSFIILCVFALINAALIWLKIKNKPTAGVRYPILFPVIGLLMILGLLLIRVFTL